jgi:cytochrome b561
MYKQKNKTHLEKFKHFVHWIKRKIILIITAFMLGMSNAMYDEDKMINGNQNHSEQEQKKD